MVARPKPSRLVEKIDTLLPSEREDRVLASILQLADELGRTPSLREVGQRLGITTSGVRHHLVALRSKGCISWIPNASGSLAVSRGLLFLGDVQ